MGLRAKVEVPEENQEVFEPTPQDNAEVPVPEETQAAVPAVQAQAAPPAVSVPKGEVPSLTQLQDRWDTDEVGNVFKRLTGTNGALYLDGKTSLGEYADVQVFSHNSRTMVVPVGNVPNDPAVKKHCRASYDHKSIFDRETGENIAISEYADQIKDQFPKGVKISKYHDIYCTVFSSQKNLEEAKKLGVVQVSISPTAVKDWFAYVKTLKFRELQGVVAPSHRNCVRLVADPRNKEGQNYIAIVFQPCPLEVIAGYTPVIEE
jgi:hypothetical protein